MTEEEINLLYELKRKLDAGELPQKEFDDAVAIIRGTKKNTEDTNTSESSQETAPAKKEKQDRKKSVIIVAIVAAVVLLSLGLFLVLHNSSTKSEEQCTAEITFPEEDVVQDLIERYCNAICENDFVTLSSLYAPMVERFQDAYNKDRDYVIGCHQRYDKTFKVYGKHSSLRWESFEMRMLNNGQLSVKIVEDYSIDREEKNKYSVFVLEKHFIIDPSYHIVSVYDNQLSKAKGNDNYKSLYQAYVREHGLADEIDEYGGWEYVYIDEDDIPELIISTGYPASGSYLLTIIDGIVIENMTSDGFSYIPHRNRIMSGRGMHMNEVRMYIETLNSGKLETLVTIMADYNDGDNLREEPLWYVDDKKVSEAKANRVIEDYYSRYGKTKGAGSDGNKLRPMDEFWRS